MSGDSESVAPRSATAEPKDPSPRHLEATLRPERGATITSLRDVAGYEWLLAPKPAPAQGFPPSTPFVEAEMGGWDECAPSIVACAAPDGQAVPDHGTLWNRPWSLDDGRARITDPVLDVRFERTVVPTPGGLRMDYAACAFGSHPVPWLWAAHPQFRAPPGSRVELDVDTVQDVLGGNGSQPWTDGLSRILTLPNGHCRKVYAPPDAGLDTATLVVPGHGRLRLRWDAGTVPYLGVWLDNCCYAREPVIALEPATGFYDSLAVAVRNRRVLWLQPGQPVQWWIEVTVDVG